MSKKKYSKSEMKKRNLFRFFIIFFAVLLVASLSLLLFVGLKSKIEIGKVDSTAKEKSNDVVEKSTPIIVNNVIVGAVYNKEWIASESYYFRNQNKYNELDIDIYNASGKKGKYKIKEVTKENSGALYVKTNNPDLSEEFFAIATIDKDIMPTSATRQKTVTNEDIKVVKKALGMYKLFNSSVKINEVYEISLTNSNKGRLFFVTNEVGKSNGGYSAVIYEDISGKTQIIKYSYVKDLKKASDWPIYSFKFVADLNQDGTNEIVILETKEFNAKYDIIEYKNNKFVEVLSTEIKI